MLAQPPDTTVVHYVQLAWQYTLFLISIDKTPGSDLISMQASQSEFLFTEYFPWMTECFNNKESEWRLWFLNMRH